MFAFVAFFESHPWVFVIYAGVLGLITGSFLNVIHARLPARLSYYNRLIQGADSIDKPDGIFYPPSRCNSCGTSIKFKHNIPVIGYVALKGRCANCGVAYGAQHLISEVVVGLTFAFCAFSFGPTIQLGLSLLLFCLIFSIAGCLLQNA